MLLVLLTLSECGPVSGAADLIQQESEEEGAWCYESDLKPANGMGVTSFTFLDFPTGVSTVVFKIILLRKPLGSRCDRPLVLNLELLRSFGLQLPEAFTTSCADWGFWELQFKSIRVTKVKNHCDRQLHTKMYRSLPHPTIENCSLCRDTGECFLCCNTPTGECPPLAGSASANTSIIPMPSQNMIIY